MVYILFDAKPLPEIMIYCQLGLQDRIVSFGQQTQM